ITAASRILPAPPTLSATNLVEYDDAGRAREGAFLGELRHALTTIAERDGEGWRAIVIDPLSRFADVDVENDGVAVTRLVAALSSLTTLPGRPAVLAAHTTALGDHGGRATS